MVFRVELMFINKKVKSEKNYFELNERQACSYSNIVLYVCCYDVHGEGIRLLGTELRCNSILSSNSLTLPRKIQTPKI